MEDMRDLCDKKKEELKELISTKELPKRTKRIMLVAMEFGFASAFCARTCDMHESWFASSQYTDTYEEFKKKLGD